MPRRCHCGVASSGSDHLHKIEVRVKPNRGGLMLISKSDTVKYCLRSLQLIIFCHDQKVGFVSADLGVRVLELALKIGGAG